MQTCGTGSEDWTFQQPLGEWEGRVRQEVGREPWRATPPAGQMAGEVWAQGTLGLPWFPSAFPASQGGSPQGCWWCPLTSQDLHAAGKWSWYLGPWALELLRGKVSHPRRPGAPPWAAQRRFGALTALPPVRASLSAGIQQSTS